MITLRVNPYSEKEVAKLTELLKRMEDELCPPSKFRACKGCEFRHVCYDLMSAREHAEKVVNESKK